MLTKKAKSLIVVAVFVIVAVIFAVSMARAKPEAKPDASSPAITGTQSSSPGSVKNSGDSASSENAPEASACETSAESPAGETDLTHKDKPTASFAAPSTASAEYVPYEFDNLVEYNGVVEHIFFHPIIAYPELAFDGDAKEKGIDDWMVTVSEYNKILQTLYDKNYILININDIWSEYTDDAGNTRMKRNTLMIPEGKSPWSSPTTT